MQQQKNTPILIGKLFTKSILHQKLKIIYIRSTATKILKLEGQKQVQVQRSFLG